MICRGILPITIDFYGLTAAPLAPQRVVGYRPTSRFLPAGYPGFVQLAVVLYQKARSRPASSYRPCRRHVGGRVLGQGLSPHNHFALATGSP